MNSTAPRFPSVVARALFALLLVVGSTALFAESYIYDANGRVTQVRYDDDTIIRYSYDSRGNITAITRAVFTFDLDVDGNGTADALTDGLLVLRYLFGFRGDALVAGAVGNGATRATAAEIEPYLDEGTVPLDIDGNGTTDALTDGLLVLRYLFGFRGDALVAGAVGNGATRSTAGTIELYIGSLIPAL